ncbi:MAG: hypothetical protein EPO35_04080 [Acidobacteria bacterium]|nr:MAG: hypothetical protein EPO35_04080 [Acidobacteriota bacterium]
MLVEGAPGDQAHADLQRRLLTSLKARFSDDYKLDKDHLIVLASTPEGGEGKATAIDVKSALARFTAAVKPLDTLFVLLLGHGNWDGTDAKFNLVGPDLTAGQWAELLGPAQGKVVFVNTTPASSPFIKALAAPNRIVITATDQPGQKFDTVFADAFVQALGAPTADLDKDSRISMWEAFAYASRVVRQTYEQKGLMQPEHAVLDDDGDGTGRQATGEGKDGTLASVTFVDAVIASRPADPELQQMVQKQEQLLLQLDALKKRKAQMKPEEYQPAWEALIIELATVSRDVRARLKDPKAASADPTN